jgi:RNA polymerase sigma factor (sigma-70 family)
LENGGPVPGAELPTSTRGCGDTPSTPRFPAEIWLDAYAHSALIWSIVRRFGVGAESSAVDVDEMFAAGLEGAVQALSAWDPAGGKAKVSWIWTRVYGAVVDELRRQSGKRTGWSRAKGERFRLYSLEEILEGHLDEGGPGGWTPAELIEEPVEYDGAEQLSFDELVVDLTAKEQEVLSLRFRDGLRLQQIGDRYGVTESRVSQIVTGAVRKLRDRIDVEAV